MNELWVGIDVSKRKLERGKLNSRVFDNDVAGHAAPLGSLRDRVVLRWNSRIYALKLLGRKGVVLVRR